MALLVHKIHPTILAIHSNVVGCVLRTNGHFRIAVNMANV